MEKSDYVDLKKLMTKNNSFFIFSLGVIFSLIILIINLSKLNLGKLSTTIALFPSYLWILLLLSFLISAVCAYYNKQKVMFIPLIIWILIFSIIIRTPNIDGLKDITTGGWTLGPDLDPFLYLRHSLEIVNNNLQDVDMMRQAPLGLKNFALSNLMPWAIVFIYNLINFFGNFDVTYAAIIAPVIFFFLSTLGFFLFTKNIFSIKYSNNVANAIAILASFLYVISPQMLHRTVAGIPEIESLGMVFFWFSLYFFTLAWKAEKKKNWIILGVIAGLFTGLMFFTWGGYRYIYMAVGLATFIMFLIGKDKNKNSLILFSWLIPSLIIAFFRDGNLNVIFSSLSDTFFALGVAGLIIVDLFVSKTSLSKRLNLPRSIISIGIGIVIGVLILLIISPDFLFSLIPRIIEGLIYPYGKGRVGLTVAENKAPYLNEAIDAFGGLIWLFLIGSFILFIEATKHFKKKEKYFLRTLFSVFLAVVTFTRISPTSLLNGENFISHFLYIGAIIVFAAGFLYLYIKDYKRNETDSFRKIDFAGIFIISFVFFELVSLRGAIRLFFIVSPAVALISAFVPVVLLQYCLKKENSDSLKKLFLWALFIVSIIILFSSSLNYAQSTYWQASSTVPSSYNQQWQKAMEWVRNNTQEGEAFVHWWDYGYWVQTLGERPTVTDGGHAYTYWDHLIGRYVLTTPDPYTALSFMKTHEVSYLLIDPTDIGKYPAYSKIGSDEDGEDRYAWIQPMLLDSRQTQETRNGTIRVYQGGIPLDEDIVYEENGTEIFLPSGKAGLGAVIFETKDQGEGIVEFSQPQVVFVYNNNQYRIPLRYLEIGGQFKDFGQGLDAAFKIFPLASDFQGSIQLDPLGAALYLSPKVREGLVGQIYLLGDALDNYPTLEVAHTEDDPIVAALKSQGAGIGEFIYYQGVRAPMKIWKVSYPEDVIIREEFLEKDGDYATLDNLEFKK